MNPLLDHGYKLTLNRNEGQLHNLTTGSTIHVRRTGRKWAVDLEDLAHAVNGSPQLQYHHAVQDMVQVDAVVTNTPKSIREQVLELHERLGHPNTEAMCQAVEGPSPTWIHTDLNAALIRSVMKRNPCIICLLAKRQKPPVAIASGDRKNMAPGECISGDIVPIHPPSHDGSTMFFLFVDVATGYMRAYTGKAKNGFLTAFIHMVNTMKKFGKNVKIFRSDSETILKNGDMGRYLEENGYFPECSAPEAHYQNFVERYVKTAVRAAATLLHGQQFLPAKYWDWALHHAIDCKNRTPNSKCPSTSPYEILTGRKVNLLKSFQFTFGDLVAVHISKERRRWKFDLRWDVGIYIGQPEASVDSAIIYYPFEGKVLERTDLVKLDITDEAYRRYYSRRHDIYDGTRSAPTRVGEILHDNEINIEKLLTLQDDEQPPIAIPLMEPTELPPDLSPQRRQRRWDHLPAPRVTRSKQSAASAMAVKVLAARASGPSITEALRAPDREEWVEAMSGEIETITNQFGCLIPEEIDTSQPYDLVHATMQLRKKMKDAVTIDKRKARLCACGNELGHIEGETYSPTVAALTHSFMLQLAVHDRMSLQLIDTVAAYLNQDYPEDATPLYVKIPKLVSLALNLDPDQTYRVKKYIYGLPDSGRAYYEAYSKHLMENGYQRSAHDPCLFFSVPSDDQRIYIWIHVDDTLVAADRAEDIDHFKQVIEKKFKITVNEKADKHLGVNISQLSDGSIKLTQSKLLQSIFDEFLEDSQRGKRRPQVPLRSTSNNTNDSPACDRRSYLHLLGMLNYLLRSRPDISTAISFAATKSVNPTMSDFERLLDIVNYLSKTKDIGLILHPGDRSLPLQLRCYVDASFLIHPDAHGHSGYCICLGQVSAFYVKSVKQALTATSSTHAEIKALYQLTVELLYIINLCDELKRPIDLPAVVFEDNAPAIQLAGDLSSRAKKSKHFLMLVNFLKEQVTMGLINIQKIHTSENIADLLTKPLDWAQFAPKAAKLLGLESDLDFENKEE